MIEADGNKLTVPDRNGNLCGVLVDDEHERAVYTDWACQIRSHGGRRVGMIGGGLLVVPSLVSDLDLDWTIFELLPEVREECSRRFPSFAAKWVMGDYTATLPVTAERFDVLIFDVDEDPQIDLAPFLADSGLFLKWEEFHA